MMRLEVAVPSVEDVEWALFIRNAIHCFLCRGLLIALREKILKTVFPDCTVCASGYHLFLFEQSSLKDVQT